jgi:glycine dehydrogenase subunit 2
VPDEKFDVELKIPVGFLRDSVEGLPELSEPRVVRHFTRLSQFNFGVDTGLYPLAPAP